MGLKLSDSRIDSFEGCVRKPLITYLSCPPGPRCFSYPQFLVDGNELFNLENAAFPDDGCLPMTVRGTTTEKMHDEFDDIVIMTVNAQPRDNEKFGYEQSRYNSIYDPTFKGSNPAIQFTALRKHRLSAMLMQVLEIQEGRIDFSETKNEKVHIFDDQSSPQTKFALVAQVVEGKKKYFGPFECKTAGNGEIQISGSGEYNFYIAGFDEDSFNFQIDIEDQEGNIAAQFIDAGEFLEKFSLSSVKYDWVPDQNLVDIIGRIAKSSEKLKFSKAKIQLLKQDILTYQNVSEQVQLTSERRERMIGLVSNYENWQDLSDEAKKEKIENADMAQLAKFVLDDENFADFYNKVIEFEGLKEKVEQAKAQYRFEEIEAKERLEKVQDELKAYESEIETKKQELLAEVEQETEAKRKESESIQEEIDRLTQNKKQLKQELGELEEGKILVQRQIRKAVEEMSDDISVSKKILESEMIKQIVASINATENRDERTNNCREQFVLSPKKDEDLLNEEQIILQIRKEIESAGRDFEYNQVVNMMICLIQGYITTLAGLPGTGKTSLASILAGVLGLRNSNEPRYCEISVEKGWTSYKDFIGYYNPFTNSLERSIAFNAFDLLDKEHNQGAALKEFLYVILLDEANLSSMEHYWSPFLKVCDTFQNEPFVIPLGDKYSFNVPEYLRFIATVNFDHTTEELSQRFLDRSWVITLDSEGEVFDENPDSINIDFTNFNPYSYSKLKTIFGFKANSQMGSSLHTKLKEVIEICESFHFPVSSRSQKMMRNYICTAERIMDKESAQSAYSPVDFAVAQKVLPQLSGTEERIVGLLEKLEAVGDLPETKKRIQRMLEIGSENGYYQYFG